MKSKLLDASFHIGSNETALSPDFTAIRGDARGSPISHLQSILSRSTLVE